MSNAAQHGGADSFDEISGLAAADEAAESIDALLGRIDSRDSPAERARFGGGLARRERPPTAQRECDSRYVRHCRYLTDATGRSSSTASFCLYNESRILGGFRRDRRPAAESGLRNILGTRRESELYGFPGSMQGKAVMVVCRCSAGQPASASRSHPPYPKACVKRETFLSLACKQIVRQAQKRWRRIRAPERIAELLHGRQFADSQAVPVDHRNRTGWPPGPDHVKRPPTPDLTFAQNIAGKRAQLPFFVPLLNFGWEDGLQGGAGWGRGAPLQRRGVKGARLRGEANPWRRDAANTL